MIDMGAAASLEARSVVKRFGDSVVLSDVDLILRPGVVHGLVGHNGAGKSTLVGILTGRLRADGGELLLDDEPVTFASPRVATEHGVVAVPQEIVMPMDMAVGEVITLGAEPHVAGFVRRGRARRRARDILASLDLTLDLDVPVSALPVSWQKVVLVAQMLHRDARVIMLDEPTAAMNSEDAARVEHLVLALRARGTSVLYISHRFDEVERLCDEVTILRDGRRVASLVGAEIHQSALVGAMMGTDAQVSEILPAVVRRPLGRQSGDSLRVQSISVGPLAAFDLEVAPGDLIGVAGLPGSGVEEIFGVLSGRRRSSAGSVAVGRRVVSSPRSAMAAGIAFLPASRVEALLADEPVVENLVLGALGMCSWAGVLTRRRARRFCTEVVERLGLESVLSRRMEQLSGGNQQRALVGSRLLWEPRFLVLEDPTVGVDVVARAQLHSLLRELAAEGLGCVIGSTEPKELAELCDETIVIRNGRIVAALSGEQLTEFAVVEAMTAVVASKRVEQFHD